MKIVSILFIAFLAASSLIAKPPTLKYSAVQTVACAIANNQVDETALSCLPVEISSEIHALIPFYEIDGVTGKTFQHRAALIDALEKDNPELALNILRDLNRSNQPVRNKYTEKETEETKRSKSQSMDNQMDATSDQRKKTLTDVTPILNACLLKAQINTETKRPHSKKYLKLAKVLIRSSKSGESINKADNTHNYPIHIACKYLSAPTNLSIIQTLLNHGANCNLPDDTGKTPYHMAMEKEEFNVACALAQHETFDHTQLDQDNKNPLHIAAKTGPLTLIKALISRNVDLNAQDNYGNTPIYYSVLGKNGAVTQYFLRDKKTQLRSDLFRACAQANSCSILEILSEKPALDIDTKDRIEGYTPLHIAAGFGSIDAAQWLLNHGANLKILDSYGRSALHYATANMHLPIIKDLISKDNAMVNTTDNNGNTPLHYFIHKYNPNNPDNTAIIDSLLDAGANPFLKNKKGDTFLDLAQKKAPELYQKAVKRNVILGENANNLF